MKKELTKLLNAARDMSLAINGAFTLEVTCSNKQGVNIALSTDKEVVKRTFTLTYRLAHDKALFTSRVLPSTSAEELMVDIPIAMEDIMSEISHKLVKNFQSGYLFGEPKEI
jgi:hypothetical protein